MSIAVLGIILVALMLAVGGRRGLKTALALALNMGAFYLLIAAIKAGAQPVAAALVACLVVGAFTLFVPGSVNEKTVSAFLSVLVTLLLLGAVMGAVMNAVHTAAFAREEHVSIVGFSFIIDLDMSAVAVACMLMGMVGAVTDTSIAVSTALYEVHRNNPQLRFGELALSGLRIGRDIMGTTMNTLFFAFLGTYTTLLLWLMSYGLGFGGFINNASFCAEYVRIMASALGCIVIIPFSAAVTASLLTGRLRGIMVCIGRVRGRVDKLIKLTHIQWE